MNFPSGQSIKDQLSSFLSSDTWGRKNSSSSDSGSDTSSDSSLRDPSPVERVTASVSKVVGDIKSAFPKKAEFKRDKQKKIEKLNAVTALLVEDIKRPACMGKSNSRLDRCLIKLGEVRQEIFAIEEEDENMSPSLSQSVGTGKAKEVKESYDPDKVLIIPRSSLKEREVRKEVEICDAISASLTQRDIPLNSSNLALEYTILSKDDQIEGKYTVSASKARYDLENALKSQELPFYEYFKFIYHIANGMNNLHQAGYVHGDLKPDNILIYKTHGFWHAKIADFGKSQSLEPGKHTIYSGNPRFSSIDSGLSYEGEVFSTALLMIRILENPFLDASTNHMLIQPSSVIDERGIHRKGIEKFVTLSEKCPQKDLSNPAQQAVFYARKQFPSASAREAVEEIHRYIDVLFEKLRQCEEPGMPSQCDIDRLEGLLKQMTHRNPSDRPAMQLVAEELWLPDEEESHLDVQRILIDKNLKKCDGAGEEWNEEEFLIPHQFSIDFSRSRYFLDGEELNRTDGMNSAVAAGIVLSEQFGYQTFLNIASICEQGSAVLLLENANKLKSNYRFGSMQDRAAEYSIKNLGDKVKMSMQFHLESRYIDDSGIIEEEDEGSNFYIAIQRDIVLSKEDLARNWSENGEGLIAPSLQVKDYYSRLQKRPEAAVEDLLRSLPGNH